jgi:hypothetical protein
MCYAFLKQTVRQRTKMRPARRCSTWTEGRRAIRHRLNNEKAAHRRWRLSIHWCCCSPWIAPAAGLSWSPAQRSPSHIVKPRIPQGKAAGMQLKHFSSHNIIEPTDAPNSPKLSSCCFPGGFLHPNGAYFPTLERGFEPDLTIDFEQGGPPTGVIFTR